VPDQPKSPQDYRLDSYLCWPKTWFWRGVLVLVPLALAWISYHQGAELGNNSCPTEDAASYSRQNCQTILRKNFEHHLNSIDYTVRSILKKERFRGH
jgi:hypothetical protein